MTLFTSVTQRLRQDDVLQSLLVVLSVLGLTLVFSWPETGAANHSWANVAQVRSVTFMLFAVGFGASSARAREGGLEALLAWWLLAILGLPIEAFAYAVSYPDAPVWWFVLQPLLDIGTYFGIGLLFGRLVRRLPVLVPLLPFFVLAALVGLSTVLTLPLLNPLAAAQLSWPQLLVTLLLTLATLTFCIRSRVRHAD